MKIILERYHLLPESARPLASASQCRGSNFTPTSSTYYLNFYLFCHFKAILVVVFYPWHTADQPDERPHARVGQLWAAQTQAGHLVLQIFLVPRGQNSANQFLLTKSTSTFFSCIIFNTDSTCVIKSSNLLLFRPGCNNIHRCY